MTDEKTCTKCGRTQALGAFFRSTRSKDGHKPSCKKCCIAAELRRQRENPQHHAERNAAWRRANPERAAAISKRYYEGHRDSQLAKARAYAADNPEKVRLARQNDKERHPDRAKRLRDLARDTLSDSYVRGAMRTRKGDVPPWLVALKREQIILHRLLQQLKEATNEP